MFECCSDVDFSCTFRNSIQDHIQKNISSRTTNSITKTNSTLNNCISTRDRTYLQWTMIGDDRPRKHLFTFLEKRHTNDDICSCSSHTSSIWGMFLVRSLLWLCNYWYPNCIIFKSCPKRILDYNHRPSFSDNYFQKKAMNVFCLFPRLNDEEVHLRLSHVSLIISLQLEWC